MPKVTKKARETGDGDGTRERVKSVRPGPEISSYSWAGVRRRPRQREKKRRTGESARGDKKTKKAKEKPAVGG